jgi:hypothetical protein
VDDDRVSELAGLLAAQQAEPAAPAYSRATFPRASFPRTAMDSPSSLLDDEDEVPVRGGDHRLVHAASAAAPSPFTAALARMVAGDRDVRQAVEEALEPSAGTRSRDDAAPWPVWPGTVGTADSSVSPPAARQEEETVGDQVVAPPSTLADQPVEVPTWAAEPEAVAASVSPREEAIADLLRDALAQGHSDEALAGILRKVLAGASPQAALTEPERTAPPILLEDIVLQHAEPAVPVVAEVAPVTAVAPAAPVVADVFPVVADATPETPAAQPLTTQPLTSEAVAPVAEIPPVSLAPAASSMWAGSASQILWGEPVASPIWDEAAPAVGAPVEQADAPIWAEVTLQEPAAPVAVLEPEAAPLTEAPAVEEQAEAVAADAVAQETVQEYLMEDEVEDEVAELAPVLARTASDPAPMMSLDVTTVMPPLSLLPPLPGSRGRGRPPVPPTGFRRPAPSAAPPAPPAPEAPTTEPAAATAPPTTEVEPTEKPAPVAEVETPAAPPAPVTRALATVTRLPVAPLMATPETPELFEEFDLDQPVASTVATPAPAPAEPAVTAVVPPAPPAPGEVAGRLEALGMPAGLLGPTFAEDVEALGTYAALTRALALRLPPPPELPSGAGEVLFVVGPGVETLRTARTLAASLRLDPDRVQWATRGDLAGLAPRSSRMTTIEEAIDRRADAGVAGTVTIVAVDAPLRTDAYWIAQMTAIWAPAAVWVVVEATRKPEDLEAWIDELPRVDALVVQDTDLSADPAAVLRRVAAPVALLDGVRATPHRWASILCERLESTKA